MRIVTEGNDLESIEPSKSFRNAEDSVLYGTLEESDKPQFTSGFFVKAADCIDEIL